LNVGKKRGRAGGAGREKVGARREQLPQKRERELNNFELGSQVGKRERLRTKML